MVRYFRLAPLAALCAAALLSGCGSGAPVPPTAPSPASGPFHNVVCLGDSLSAGFENGSLLDSQQANGYGSLVAAQAGFGVTLPYIAAPGAPAVLQLTSPGFPPGITQSPGITTGRDNAGAQPSDLAVPGHLLHDVIYRTPTIEPKTDEDIITDLVLGLPLGNLNSQLAEAVALHPSTVFLWAGNDDALGAVEAGSPAALTSLSSFAADYTLLLAALRSQTSANLIVANIPDVTMLPYLTPATVVINEVAGASGLPGAVVAAALGIAPGDLINATGLADIEADIAGVASGHPPAPLPDNAFLTPAEILAIQNAINSYNQVIAQQAAAAGATLVDIHAYFATLAAGITINGYTATDTFLGGLFGLDGIPPTNTGYALVANQFVAALNAKFGLAIAPVNVGAIAAADPYFGPNIRPAGVTRIPTTAAERADGVIANWKKTSALPLP